MTSKSHGIDELITSAKHAVNVEQEIKDHGVTWCHRDCKTFLPAEYERMRSRYGKGTVQRDYNMCHVWR